MKELVGESMYSFYCNLQIKLNTYGLASQGERFTNKFYSEVLCDTHNLVLVRCMPNTTNLRIEIGALRIWLGSLYPKARMTGHLCLSVIKY